jgi:hypothetical protein
MRMQDGSIGHPMAQILDFGTLDRRGLPLKANQTKNSRETQQIQAIRGVHLHENIARE